MHDPIRYTVFDIETTGLYPQRGARIIEIGAVAVREGAIVGEFSSLINCQCEIPPHVQRIHGITNDALAGQPLVEEVLPRFMDFVADSILVAHNAKFDIKFLRYELSRMGRGLPNRSICTMKLSKKRFPELPNHKLGTVARHVLGEMPPDLHRHRALDDARLTARVWMEMERR